jgi:hypothetical protein
LGALAVVFVDINHQRGDGPMPAERADLVQPEPGPLSEFGRLGDAGMSQAVTPDVQADLLPSSRTMRNTLRVSRRPSEFLPRLPRVWNNGPFPRLTSKLVPKLLARS